MSMITAICVVLVLSSASLAGEFPVSGLRIGAEGDVTRVDAKVRQVIDDKSMLVGIEDARTGNGSYRVVVLIRCDTTGIVDGQHWRGGGWKKIVGSNSLKVTETYRYKTVGGGSRTVFVVEGVK